MIFFFLVSTSWCHGSWPPYDKTCLFFYSSRFPNLIWTRMQVLTLGKFSY